MSERDAVDDDHMAVIRAEVKSRARHGATLKDIIEWLNSNGYSPEERYIGRLLAKTEVRRARSRRVRHYIETLEGG